jgi:hypothetical protein
MERSYLASWYMYGPVGHTLSALLEEIMENKFFRKFLSALNEIFRNSVFHISFPECKSTMSFVVLTGKMENWNRLWLIYALLDSYRWTSNETTAIARQQLRKCRLNFYQKQIPGIFASIKAEQSLRLTSRRYLSADFIESVKATTTYKHMGNRCPLHR